MNRIITLSFLVLALALPASAYTVVNASAPQVNCVFTTATPCSVTVTDMVSALPNGGKIQSRVFQSTASSPAAGRWIYEYRLIMTHVAGIGYPPYLSGMSISNFGPIATLDYNFDWLGEQVFNISSGGLGTKGVGTSYYFWGTTYFNLTEPVYAGSYPGGGESSYFFGVASPYPPTTRTATVYMDSIAGGSAPANVYAPAVP